MEILYFLTPDGAKMHPIRVDGEHNHVDIARRVLKGLGITPKDYEDTYNQMFLLGYVRVVEYDDRVFAENHLKPLTPIQKSFLQSEQIEKKKEVKFNTYVFETTREGNANARRKVEALLNGNPGAV